MREGRIRFDDRVHPRYGASCDYATRITFRLLVRDPRHDGCGRRRRSCGLRGGPPGHRLAPRIALTPGVALTPAVALIPGIALGPSVAVTVECAAPSRATHVHDVVVAIGVL